MNAVLQALAHGEYYDITNLSFCLCMYVFDLMYF